MAAAARLLAAASACAALVAGRADGASAAAAAGAAGDLQLVMLDRATYPLAVCNDGTMAGYYLRKGSSNDWIVHQEGGGWCWDAATCAGRSKALTSSSGWAASKTPTPGSILAAADPAMAAASFVYAPYCSSDGWAGSAAAAPPTGFAFRGHNIVTAIFSDLAARQGLGAAAGTRVLYGGCSAGARGALFNLDRVAFDLLPSLVPAGNLARVGGLLDSAFWMALTPLDAKAVSFEEQSKDVVALANATSADASACVKAYPGELWKCVFGQYAVPFLRADFFLHAFQYDMFQLSGDTGVPVPDKTPAQLQFCEEFRNATRASFAADVVQQDGPGRNAGLMPACYKHCNTEGSTFGTLLTNGVSLETAVSAWFFGEGAAKQFVVEDCAGFNCGTDCPSV